jgi:hypothetical protein
MSKAKAKEPRKGGMPSFEPTQDERALVKLLAANGYAQHLICQYIGNRRGSHISESTLRRVFAHELELGAFEIGRMAYACLVPRRSDYDSLSWASRVAAAGSG